MHKADINERISHMPAYLYYILLALGGICAGMINGFLGSGGGIILIFVMTVFASRIFPENKQNGNNEKTKSLFATAVASILPMSAVSVIFYLTRGSFDIGESLIFLIPAAIGGTAGALLMEKLSPAFLRVIFAALMIWAGIRMF